MFKMTTNSDAQHKKVDVIALSKFSDSPVLRKSHLLFGKYSSNKNAKKHYHMSKVNLNDTNCSSFKNVIATKNSIASKSVKSIGDKGFNT